MDPLIGEMPRRADGRGRPWRSSREVLNGILWILRTGAQWADLPDRYPPYQTCHRRFQRWVREGVFERVLEALARDLKERGKLDLSECFIDGTFVVAKKGAAAWVRPSGAKVRSSWQWQTVLVFLSPSVPPRLRLTRVTLVAPTLDSRFVEDLPQRLIGDRAYDADPTRRGAGQAGRRDDRAPSPRTASAPRPKMAVRSAATGVAGRSNGSSLGWATSGGSSCATSAHALNYLGFVQLGCILILLRQGL